MSKFIIITSIQAPTEAVKKFAEFSDWKFVLVGDKKTPDSWSWENVTYLSPHDQLQLPYNVVKKLPWNHYSRKNIGYLYAIENGAEVIYETDDDNIPYEYWKEPLEKSKNIITSENSTVNVYKHFTDEEVWPRGYPLDKIKDSQFKVLDGQTSIGVWQGLADIDPDVDAIYRLVFNKPIFFTKNVDVALDQNVYCPFNSQNTFWRKESFPLMYLPAAVSFRFTDILRSYIVQRLLWQEKLHLGFTHASVYQERNEHNLLKDLSDEVECYLSTNRVIELLEDTKLEGNIYDNIYEIYDKLINAGIVPGEERKVVEAWISDVRRILN